jgi:bacteriocin biosynthesis cyclodehydratase domain-containing protein
MEYTHMNKPRNAGSGLQLYIQTVGSFGEKIGDVLKELWQGPLGGVSVRNNEPSATDWPDADLFVLAAWRPVPHLCRLFEQRSYVTKTPFIPIFMEAPHLQVGPVVVPGIGACYTCFEKRVLQHSARRDSESARRHFYETHPDSGPKGFLIPFAEIAAIRLIHILSALKTDPVSVAGGVWRLDTITRQVTCGQTVGIHGCIRCGLGFAEEKRSFAMLHTQLERFLPGRRFSPEVAFAIAE